MKKNTDNNMTFPRGTTWTPVETALSDLKKSLTMNLKCQKTEVSNSLGFILSEDVFAKRSNPHMANTAVDGFGFAFKSLIGPKNFLNLITINSRFCNEFYIKNAGKTILTPRIEF